LIDRQKNERSMAAATEEKERKGRARTACAAVMEKKR